MHTPKIYKIDLKKYCKSEVGKCISVEIQLSDRADLVDMCPDFDFFLKRQCGNVAIQVAPPGGARSAQLLSTFTCNIREHLI